MTKRRKRLTEVEDAMSNFTFEAGGSWSADEPGNGAGLALLEAPLHAGPVMARDEDDDEYEDDDFSGDDDDEDYDDEYDDDLLDDEDEDDDDDDMDDEEDDDL